MTHKDNIWELKRCMGFAYFWWWWSWAHFNVFLMKLGAPTWLCNTVERVSKLERVQY